MNILKLIQTGKLKAIRDDETYTDPFGYNERVYSVLCAAEYHGANLSLLDSAVDHKGALTLTWKEPWIIKEDSRVVSIDNEVLKTAHLITQAWEYVGMEPAETVYHELCLMVWK